jgi:8-oxo-dGTP pyrophosphatase MutT (NUDIX family)
MPAADATPAATVVITRDGHDGIEVLMVRRNSKHAFGGMWVFPGGKVDPGDVDPDHADDEECTARRAAAREAREEAGLLLAPDDLVTVSHWTPPPEAPRRFTTWFFATAAPSEHDVVIDGHEIQEHAWLTPAETLRRADALHVELAPPTWMTLYAMTRHARVDAFLADLAASEPPRFATHIGRSGEDAVAIWEGDVAYEDGDLDRDGPRHRLYMRRGGWFYVGEENTPAD